VRVLKGVAGDGEGYLLIDDLVDTGRTAQAVRQLLPKAYFATLYAKPAGRPIVDLFVKEFKQTKWIHFPWDIEYTFATPIKDGGRAAAGPG
jgi:xanthine phosphoribosyltransferase